MRIGLVAAPWIPIPPAGYGGIERVIDSLARGFVAAGHEVLLAASSDSTCPVPRVPGMRPSEPAELGFTLSELSHVIRAYEGLGDVDIIHDHTLGRAAVAGRRGAPPVVTTIHGPLIPASADLYRADGRDTAIIAISRDQASHVPDVPVTRVIHHGMDVAAVPVGAGKGGYACFVGRMCPDKGVVEAIHIARAGRAFRCALPPRCASRRRSSISAPPSSPSWAPTRSSSASWRTTKSTALMGDAMAFLNPIQWSEPFGLVMIESLSTGTPVVGTPIGSAPEIVDSGKTGYLALDGPAASLPAPCRVAGPVALQGPGLESFSALSGWLPTIWTCTPNSSGKETGSRASGRYPCAPESRYGEQSSGRRAGHRWPTGGHEAMRQGEQP